MLFNFRCVRRHPRAKKARTYLNYCIPTPIAASHPRARAEWEHTAAAGWDISKKLRVEFMPSCLSAHASSRLTTSSGLQPIKILLLVAERIYTVSFLERECFLELCRFFFQHFMEGDKPTANFWRACSATLSSS